MSYIHFPGRRSVTVIACVYLVSLLAACGTPDGGYYDANGNWIATDTPHNMQTNAHSPLPGGTRDYHHDRADYGDNHYDRRGYYDRNGDYITRDDGLNVPENM
ncbi:MAG: hypothetical protein KGJ21_05765, partial [Pseudomonadota bacterium]|nr:hypothetical protein [Pseudomonadota bacterium]